MAWPSPQDYNEAVQNAHLAFADAELRGGQPALNRLGLPQPISGGFACVYRMQTSRGVWAARCFLTEVTDQQQRYAAISRHLDRVRLPYMVPFTYLARGIRVLGKEYPLLKMQWVQGELLASFVGRSLGYPDTLLSLAAVWGRMVADLQAAGISHGDLQHGNVLVVGDQLRLIDYDGMFVPELQGMRSREFGHRNFQHPARSEFDFGPTLDNFSAWVVYVSLLALAVHPELWGKHRGGDECLLFRSTDFSQGGGSPLFGDLMRSPHAQLRSVVQLFESLLSFSPQEVPSLDGRQASLTLPGAAPPVISGGGRNWWEDHKGGAPVAGEPAQAEPVPSAPSVPDVTWIVEGLAGPCPSVEELRFQGSVAGARAVCLASWVVLLVAGWGFGMGLGFLVACGLVLLGLHTLFLFAKHGNDPNVLEHRKFMREVQALTRQVQKSQAVVEAHMAERSSVQQRLAEAERRAAAEQARLRGEMQAELGRVQGRLDGLLAQVEQARRADVQAEADDLRQAERTYGGGIASRDREITELPQKEREEKDAVLKGLRDGYIRDYLRRHLISEGGVPGIGATYSARLSGNGFVTAADISYRVMGVSGIGSVRCAALEAWRRRLETRAQGAAPAQLPRQTLGEIESRFQERRRRLQAEKGQLEAQLQGEVAGIRGRHASVRQGLAQQEQRHRSDADKERSTTTQRFQAVDRSVVGPATKARAEAAGAMKAVGEKLTLAQKGLFSLHWEVAKLEREGARFASLRFWDYLSAVTWSWAE